MWLAHWPISPNRCCSLGIAVQSGLPIAPRPSIRYPGNITGPVLLTDILSILAVGERVSEAAAFFVFMLTVSAAVVPTECRHERAGNAGMNEPGIPALYRQPALLRTLPLLMAPICAKTILHALL